LTRTAAYSLRSPRSLTDERSSATSLLLEEQRPLDRNPIVIALLKQLEHLTQKIDLGFDTIIREVRERSWLLGKRVTANTNQETVEGVAVDVDGEGRLIVRKDDDTLLMLNSAEQVRLVS
jgi:BirA family biotin operon repressor/biotin-[acetyl-CoA-carboxylase] ligase